MKLSVAMLVVVMVALSSIEKVAAADAPAPSPTSDAITLLVPTFFASLAALAFEVLF